MIVKSAMDDLRGNIGEVVTVVESGSILGPDFKETHKLTAVEDFCYITIGYSIGGSVCGFISEYGAIKKVTRERDGKILYENPHIKDDWTSHVPKPWTEVDALRELSFGPMVAAELKSKERR